MERLSWLIWVGTIYSIHKSLYKGHKEAEVREIWTYYSLKMKEGTSSHGMGAAFRNWKGKETEYAVEPPVGMQPSSPADALILVSPM